MKEQLRAKSNGNKKPIMSKPIKNEKLSQKLIAKKLDVKGLSKTAGVIKETSKGFKFEYAPSIESKSIVKVKQQYGHFIQNKFIAPKSGKYFETENPATGEILSNLAEGNDADVNLAVEAATSAYENVWSKMSGSERGRYLYRIARIMQERAREFAVLESLDGGKPIKESRDIDIPLASAHFFYYAGWADKLEYAAPGRQFSPIGVCGQIIPWNFPLLMAAWKLAPALACGNTVVLKPAEQTSLTALLLADVLVEAELPPGVINIVTGAGATGAALVKHPGIKKIAFTGSTDIGKLIVKNASNSDKRLTLELGGKSAHIVFEDAAIDQAVEAVINGIYFNQGHVCCAGSRLLLEESIEKVFVQKLKRRMESLRVGDPLDKNTDIGAINSKEQLLKINEIVGQAKSEGCSYYEPASIKLPTKGYFHKPGFFTDTTPSSTINRVEVFGPVLSILTFRTPDEAIKKANDTNFGLAAGVWSEKSSKIAKTAKALKAGVIWTNTYNKFDPSSPFGGFKESGYGREGGLQGLYPYLNIK